MGGLKQSYGMFSMFICDLSCFPWFYVLNEGVMLDCWLKPVVLSSKWEVISFSQRHGKIFIILGQACKNVMVGVMSCLIMRVT